MTTHLATDTLLDPLPSHALNMDDAHARIRNIVGASGTSFFWAMRLLPKERREAIFAVYGFCREVDDIVDEDGIDQDKRRELDNWRHAISRLYAHGNPSANDENMAAILTVLSKAIKDYKLEEADFQAVIDGMEMDAHGPVAISDMAISIAPLMWPSILTYPKSALNLGVSLKNVTPKPLPLCLCANQKLCAPRM